jgi:conjugal transfer mating pair stabilization protein TraN
MKKLFTSIFLSFICISSFAQSTGTSACRKTGTECVEGAETRVVNGAEIYKACWRSRDTYECVDEGTVDTCAGLRSASACIQTNSVCTERAFNHECLNFRNTYNCSAQQPTSSGVILLTTTYTVTNDGLDAQQCKAYTENPSCTKTGSVCVEAGGTRIVNGLPVTKDCWAYQDTYSCKSLENDCGDLKKNDSCTLQDSFCADLNTDGTCAVTEYNYRCLTGTSPPKEVTQCTGGVRCVNGMCFTAPAGNDEDFAKAITTMEVGRQAAGYARDANEIKFFAGNDNRCGRHALKNCCKTNTKGAAMSNGAVMNVTSQAVSQGFGSWYVYDMLDDTVRNSSNALSGIYAKFADPNAYLNFEPTGISFYGVTFNPFGAGQVFSFDPWSFAIQVAIQILMELITCDQDESLLAMKRGQNLCHYVGTYCSQKILGSCVARKQSYCCFNSRLARIVQEQGRQQLGRSWGDPKSPDCSGLSAEDFQRLDFSQMDFGEFADEIMKNTRMPNPATVNSNANTTIQNRVQNYFNR